MFCCFFGFNLRTGDKGDADLIKGEGEAKDETSEGNEEMNVQVMMYR